MAGDVCDDGDKDEVVEELEDISDEAEVCLSCVWGLELERFVSRLLFRSDADTGASCFGDLKPSNPCLGDNNLASNEPDSSSSSSSSSSLLSSPNIEGFDVPEEPIDVLDERRLAPPFEILFGRIRARGGRAWTRPLSYFSFKSSISSICL